MAPGDAMPPGIGWLVARARITPTSPHPGQSVFSLENTCKTTTSTARMSPEGPKRSGGGRLRP